MTLLYFRLAYIFRRPIFEIKKWPTEEILAWKAFFRLFGPLDWQRDDLRDARQAWIHGGKEGSTVEDCQLYPAPTVETEADRAIKRIESILADNESRGDAEHAENCRREIRRIQRESALENATGSR